MISAGNATVYVSDMDAAVRFYSETLGLRLTNRFGNAWATVQVGETLVIGLHPRSANHPKPGTKGSIQIGLVLRDEPITEFAARLRKHGVEVSGIIESQEANYVTFADPDGNSIYIGDQDYVVEADHESTPDVEPTVGRVAAR